MFEFAWPATLLLLPLPWILRWILPPAKTHAAALQVSFLARLTLLLNHAPLTRSTRLSWPFVLIWSLLIFAACRPQWLGEPLPIEVSGRDMMLAIDLSGSMEYRDMSLDNEQVDRLTLIKSLMGEFIEQRRGDRVGLILFGSEAYVQAPLSHDLSSISTWLNEAFVGLAGRQTAIGNALGLSIKRLSSEPAQSRVLILVTDGANNAGQLSPMQAARLAADQGIRIFTVGIGTDQPQELPPGAFSREADPSIELDEGLLTDIALLTGGDYFRARDEQDFRTIYQRIATLEPALRSGRALRQSHPLYAWPLGLALLASFALAGRHVIRSPDVT